MSWPAASARKAPWAAAWQALAGAPERLAHANHSAYDLSSAVGPWGLASSRCFCSTTSQDDVFDFSGWAAGVTAREYVAYAAYFKATSKDAVEAILERFELTDAAEFEMDMLPADLQLRAGLAATCVHRPDLVFLDEPLGSVTDPERDELIAKLDKDLTVS